MEYSLFYIESFHNLLSVSKFTYFSGTYISKGALSYESSFLVSGPHLLNLWDPHPSKIQTSFWSILQIKFKEKDLVVRFHLMCTLMFVSMKHVTYRFHS